MFVEIRNILLPLNGTIPLQNIMPTALLMARQFGARLSTVLLNSTTRQLVSLAGESLATGMVGNIVDDAIEHIRQRREDIRHYFDSLEEQSQHHWHDLSRTNDRQGRKNLSAPKKNTSAESCPQTTFELLDDTTENAIVFRSRLADMTLVPSLGSNQDKYASDILHNVLYDSGRPLLIAPPTPPAQIGHVIAIAWNGSAESSAALRCVLPWAHRAKKVILLHAPQYQRSGPDVKEAQSYLALHGITAHIHHFHAEKRQIGATLLEEAHQHDADMLTIGAYSHSRLRQMVLGGVTRHILAHADLTVLMSR